MDVNRVGRLTNSGSMSGESCLLAQDSFVVLPLQPLEGFDLGNAGTRNTHCALSMAMDVPQGWDRPENAGSGLAMPSGVGCLASRSTNTSGTQRTNEIGADECLLAPFGRHDEGTYIRRASQTQDDPQTSPQWRAKFQQKKKYHIVLRGIKVS